MKTFIVLCFLAVLTGTYGDDYMVKPTLLQLKSTAMHNFNVCFEKPLKKTYIDISKTKFSNLIDMQKILGVVCPHSDLFLHCLNDFDETFVNVEYVRMETDKDTMRDIHFFSAIRRALHSTLCVLNHQEIDLSGLRCFQLNMGLIKKCFAYYYMDRGMAYKSKYDRNVMDDYNYNMNTKKYNDDNMYNTNERYTVNKNDYNKDNTYYNTRNYMDNYNNEYLNNRVVNDNVGYNRMIHNYDDGMITKNYGYNTIMANNLFDREDCLGMDRLITCAVNRYKEVCTNKWTIDIALSFKTEMMKQMKCDMMNYY